MKNTSTSTRTYQGFTLIELLLVIALIAILSTIVFALVGNIQEKGRDTKRVADVKSIQSALELYRIHTGFGVPADAGAAQSVLAPLVTGGYIQIIPAGPPDPLGNDNYYYSNSSTPTAMVAGDIDNSSYAIRFYMEQSGAFGPGGQYYCATSAGIEPSEDGMCTQK